LARFWRTFRIFGEFEHPNPYPSVRHCFVHHKYHTDFHETESNTNNTYTEGLILLGLVFKLMTLHRLQPLLNLVFKLLRRHSLALPICPFVNTNGIPYVLAAFYDFVSLCDGPDDDHLMVETCCLFDTFMVIKEYCCADVLSFM
jgi:hypothetical protein